MLSRILRRWFDSRRPKPSQTPRRRRLFMEPLEDRRLLATFMVENTNDGGPDSLRQAIIDANSNSGADEIHFNIEGEGVHKISPTSDLPTITGPVTIDGYTQPGAKPNTNATGGLNTVLKVELTASNPGSGFGFIVFATSDVTIKGLAINRFHTGIHVTIGTSNIRMEGNFIGTDPSGTVDLGNVEGVSVFTQLGAAQVVVGGATAAARNLISGNNLNGLSSSGNFNGFNDVTVQGNLIGTDVTGLVAVPNEVGIRAFTAPPTRLVIGGIAAAEGNFISGNTADGINIGSLGTSFLGTIRGNTIGVAADGVTPRGNGGNGISIAHGPTTIGGNSTGERNFIAFNGQSGVLVNGGQGIDISGNSIFSNARLGIDLGNGAEAPFGVTPNDLGDADTGPNDFQNYPELTDVVGGSTTTVTGTLNSTPNTTFRLEFFASAVADPSGFGEGERYLGFGTVTTDASGNAPFDSASFATPLGASTAGEFISATATTPDGSTSEFSLVVTATSEDIIIDANTPQSFLDSLTVIEGSLIMVGVAGRTDLLLPNLTQVDGDFIVTGNPDLTTLSAPLLATIGGNKDVSDNPALTDVNLSNVTSVGGDLSINNNQAATDIDVTSLATVTGNVSINGNQAATDIDLSSLATVTGNVSINGNTASTGVDLSSLSTVGGDMAVEAMNSIIAVTAAGSTEVALFSAEAQMTAVLPTDTFASAVDFTVTRLDPAALPPEPGLDSTGFSATIDPLAAYQFDFAIPTLGQDAALTFEINVHMLLPADREAFLAPLAAGDATLAVKNDALGSVFQAFAICAPGQTPAADDCITLTRLDASGNPLPAGSTDTPATVRFDGVTGHFSTFAVVIVSPSGPTDNSPPVATDDTALLSASTSIHIAVLANDTDPNGDTLSVTAVTQPASGHGTVTINADGTLTYTQTVFVNGTETFTYTISDGHGGTATATVTLTVNLPATVGIDMLLGQVRASTLSRGLKTSLTAKLSAAQHSLAKGNARAAANQLNAFANQVRALKRTHHLAADQADLWLFEIDNILAAIPRPAISNQQLMRSFLARGGR